MSPIFIPETDRRTVREFFDSLTTATGLELLAIAEPQRAAYVQAHVEHILLAYEALCDHAERLDKELDAAKADRDDMRADLLRAKGDLADAKARAEEWERDAGEAAAHADSLCETHERDALRLADWIAEGADPSIGGCLFPYDHALRPVVGALLARTGRAAA